MGKRHPTHAYVVVNILLLLLNDVDKFNLKN